MNSVLSATFVVLCLVSKVFSEECDLSQVHITLGDFFSLNTVSDHAFTIGMVTQDCQGTFMLGLMEEGGEVYKNIYANYRKNASIMMTDNSTYVRSAVFFNISVQDSETTHSWAIFYNKTQVYGPVKLSKKVLKPDGEFKMAVIADMDLTKYSKETIDRMQEWNADDYDCFMHIGDFAYDIFEDGGAKGDEFFNKMSGVTQSIPYIITPGNHENYAIGALFNYRFRMPNTDPNMKAPQQNHYYDFLVKDHYFISVNFDSVLFFPTPFVFENTLKWLSDRLELAKNNTNIRWKVFFSHRPIFCSDLLYSGDCSYNLYALQPFQDILIRHNVTVVLNGHLHIYSRMKPFTNFKILPLDTVGKGSYLEIITGHAGTEHFFPDTSLTPLYESPIVEKIDLTGPTYMQIWAKPDTFEGKLHLSKDDSVLDSFVFETNLPKKETPIWIYYLLATLAVIFTASVAILFWCYLRKLKEERVEVENPDKEPFIVDKNDPSVNKLNLGQELDSQSCRHSDAYGQ